MKPTFPQIISLTALVAACILFVVGQAEAGAMFLAFAGGQLVPSPIMREFRKDDP